MARGVLRSVPPEVVLVLGCLADGVPIRTFPHRGYWLDLGLMMFAVYLLGCAIGALHALPFRKRTEFSRKLE